MKINIMLLLCSAATLYACDKGRDFIGIYANSGTRPTQEDRYVCKMSEEGLFLAVFDGHNGETVADFAANALPFFYEVSSGSVAERMREAFQRVDNHNTVKQQKKCGSTASVVLIDSEVKKVHFAHIGNSRAVLEKNGIIAFATQDHVLDRADEKCRIENLGGHLEQDVKGVLRVENFLSLSRVFGDWCIKEYVSADPEYADVELTPENRYVILATDGLWRVMNNEKVICTVNEYVKNCLNNELPVTSNSISSLLGHIAARTSNDNITIMVVDLLLLASHHCIPSEKNSSIPRDRTCDFFSFLLY